MMSPRVQIPGVGLSALDARYVNVTGDIMIGALTVPDLTIGSLAGVLKASSGIVSGSATTTDLPEGTNQYFTTARARASLSATSPVTYNSSTGVIAFDTATTTLTAYHKLAGDTGTGTYNIFPSSDIAALVLKAGGTSTSIKTFELQDSSGNPWFYIRKRLLSDSNSGSVFDFTTSGSGGTPRTGFVVNLAAGYTGGEFTGALAFDNAVAGTATYYLADATTYGYRPGGNRGFGGFARAVTTGHNVGGMVLAGGGAINYGLFAGATITKASAINVGIFANAHNASGTSPSWIGLYATCFNTNLTTPPNMTGVKTALLADNQSYVCDIGIFRDNGTEVFKIADGGAASFTASATAGGIAGVVIFPGNHNTVVAEKNTLYVRGNTFTITGGFTTFRNVLFDSPTIDAASGLTVTNAANVAINGAPIVSGSAIITNAYALWVQSGNSRFDGRSSFGGVVAATALIHLAAGTTTASTAPLKFTTGVSLTTAEAGAMEFTTDDLYFTISTGSARKGVVLNDGANLTPTRIPFATTNGRLTDDSDLTFVTDTLTATKIVGTTSIKIGTVAGYISSDNSTGATGTFTTADLKTVTVKDGIITSIV